MISPLSGPTVARVAPPAISLVLLLLFPESSPLPEPTCRTVISLPILFLFLRLEVVVFARPAAVWTSVLFLCVEPLTDTVEVELVEAGVARGAGHLLPRPLVKMITADGADSLFLFPVNIARRCRLRSIHLIETARTVV